MDVCMRTELERREHEILSPKASFADSSLGRGKPEPADPLRTCYQRDRDRILHSKSFRRLANKTQVFLAPEGDHYRTRLTHTLEVAQIARDIARPLRLNEDLTEAIALGHDLGHTPFGHAGERALRRAMARHLGIDPRSDTASGLFRHNEQSVRVTELYERDGRGLNLSLEVLDGMRCHAGSLHARTLEGRIVARADRIAYVTHDIDDAERAGLLTEEMLPIRCREVLGGSSSERIATMVHDAVSTSAAAGDIEMSDKVWGALMGMRAFLFSNLYKTGDAKSEEPKAEHVVEALFDYYANHLGELPSEYETCDAPDEVRVADYISSMTDRFAIRRYQDLFVPRAWGLR
ncbi:MAG: deoxyguanosinetriphosphate triphosphohydrolase [Parafannyhessea sp.]|uniref:deoxyguanosinetriphosphate triphosphohydrolase n=1 Tax=Parafannyhessea sp. TaxID=2847324 RepID=UPI003F02A562